MSHLAFFAHANVFHYRGQSVPIELYIARIPDGKDPEVICITVDHSNLVSTEKDCRANRYINEILCMKWRTFLDPFPWNTCLFVRRVNFVTWPKETGVLSSRRDRSREQP
ncbi:hypothetical protein TNCV_5002191 [Trichonephila clavipes]|nr:hypothetical protein TNCV_5002191 [Trichonephila clavipes]